MSPALLDIEVQEERVPPCLFPSSSLSPTDKTTELGAQELVLTDKLDAVRQFLQESHITLPTALQTAWALTLRCFVSCDILSFGYHASTLDGHEKLALVGRVDNTETIAVCLQRIEEQKQASGAPVGFEIHAIPYEPNRALCNTAVIYDELGHAPEGVCDAMQIDLAIAVRRESSSRLTGCIVFDDDLIGDSIATSVLYTFRHVLSQILHGLHNRVPDLCSNEDRVAIKRLTERVSSPDRRCLHDIIVEQCRAHPERMAVASWDGDLTYGELDELSLRLAHHLVSLGVGPERFVLSCFEKSTWAIVARLAVLRAGGAYISIHATNPPIYLDSVIQRTEAGILLSDVKFAARFQHLVPNFVGITPEWLRSLPLNHAPPCDTVAPENACLVLFTSGSTGQPKGIVQVHQSYTTAIQDYVRNLGLDSTTRMLHFDDYAFDISNLELLVPLTIGGCCCVPPPVKTTDNLITAISNLRANITFLTPTVAIKLNPADISSLHTICVGGEPLPKELIDKYSSSSTRLINQFGMGEVAICCAYNDSVHPDRGNTIGRPASGPIYIVDSASPERLLPLGSVGELLIEGPHLSRRYLDNTAVSRTAAGFLSKTPRWMAELHPERSVSRMYRTGDLGRLNADGTLDYIGRKDTILKLDGCRVDAIEVEHQARKCLSPADAIVVDLLGAIDGTEDPQIAALLYLDGHPGSTVPGVKEEPVITNAEEDGMAREKADTIRDAIRQALPPYMVPSVFLLMSWMPRTASKKTDRKKIRMLAQKYYMAERKLRMDSPYYVQQSQVLPP